MSKPNFPPGRQSSRTDLNAGSEGVSAEDASADSESSSSSQEKQPGKPKFDQPARRRAGTWVAATASSNAASPRAGANTPSTDMTTAREKSSEPKVRQRVAVPPLPTIPTTVIPSTSNPSTSTTSTSTPSSAKPATYLKSKVPGERIPDDLTSTLRACYQGMKSVPDPTNPAKTIQVPVFNIPPKQIASLMVGMECNFGAKAPSGDDLTKPLRDRFAIVGFQVNSALVLKEINVIEQILVPFTERVFNTPEAEQARIEVRDRFNEFVSGPHKNLLKTEEGRNAKQGTLQNLVFRKEFNTVIQPLENFVFGAGRSLESSQVATDFKVFLKEIVSCYIDWSKQQNIPPDQLTNMMKSALVGVLFIRGLLPVWNAKFEQEMQTEQHNGSEWVKWKAKLTAQLAHYTSFLSDDFVLDVIGSVDNKPKQFDQYFKPLMKAAILLHKEATMANQKLEKGKRLLNRGATISSGAASGSQKKPNLGNLIQGLISPRKKETASTAPTPVSPRGAGTAEGVQSSDGLLLKKTETRTTKVIRGYKRELNNYLKTIQLPAYDPGYLRHMNEAIAKRANYEVFELAPAAFCLQQLKRYLDSLNATGATVPPGLNQVQLLLSQLAIQERSEAEQATQQAKATQASRDANPTKQDATSVKKVSAKPASIPTLDLATLRQSPFAEEQPQPAQGSASMPNERSESTEVGTEESQNETPDQVQTDQLEFEKNRS